MKIGLPHLAVLAALAAMLAACAGSDDADSAADTTATSVTTTMAPEATTTPETTAAAPATTEAAPEGTAIPATTVVPETTAAPSTTIAPNPNAWARVDPGSDCMCADGSDFALFERPADPTKVVLYLEGGGACFDESTCSFTDGTYTSSIDTDSLTKDAGLFDATNPENPLADHSIVYVPYCTGDVHIGNATTQYGELTVEHNGYINASAGLDLLATNYPDATQVIVAGASAGSVGTPLFAGLAADAFPEADIITIGDSSGAYPDVPAINELIGVAWGVGSVIPDWTVNEGLTASDWGFPDQYVQAGRHAPGITFARFDYAFDETQAFFGSLAGVAADELVTLIDETEAQIEAAGIPVAAYVAPGNLHTIIGTPTVYEMEVEGVRLIDWLAELVAGEVPADVHCTECQPVAP